MPVYIMFSWPDQNFLKFIACAIVNCLNCFLIICLKCSWWSVEIAHCVHIWIHFISTPLIKFQDAFKLHRMDIRLGRLKMPLENSLGYYELPPGDVLDTIQPSSSVPIEKTLASTTLKDICQPEQSESSDKQEEATRYNCLLCVSICVFLSRQLKFRSLFEFDYESHP